MAICAHVCRYTSLQTIQTSSPGSIDIVEAADYDRAFGNHTVSPFIELSCCSLTSHTALGSQLQWFAFAILAAVAVFGPYLIWNESKSKYEALEKAK